MPGSPSYHAGLVKGDEIIAVNGFKADSNFDQWIGYFSESEIQLDVVSQGHTRRISLQQNGQKYFNKYSVVVLANPSKEQVSFFHAWNGLYSKLN